jgi:hypothetical protein
MMRLGQIRRCRCPAWPPAPPLKRPPAREVPVKIPARIPVLDLWRRLVRPGAVLTALFLVGCAGQIDANGNGTGSGGSGTGPADPKAAGVMPLRRLTAREYLNTARDLLGDMTLDSGDVPGESDDLSNNAFPFRQPGVIGNFEAGNLQAAAETLASHLATKLSSVLPCTPANSAAEAGCASQFITTFGAKAYRRPLSTTEVTDLTAMYQTGRTTLGLDFNGAIDLLIETMLQSPQFVYHWEMDPGPAVKDGNVVQLGNYQIANRLSYFLWGTMPDQALFAAAAAGQLTSVAGLQTQIQRLLSDPKAADMAADFFDDWLDVNVLSSRPKDATLYPMWNQDLATAMENEFRTFGSATLTGSGSFADLLTGTSTSVNQALAAVYKVSGVTGTTPKPATLDATQRSGLLTLAGFLTVTGASDGSSPVRRGHAIYTRLLCNVLPNPPNNVPPPQPPTPGLTTRDRFLQHDQNSCTGSCHNAMDPIGFGFEHYDGIGQFRTTDQNLPVDASGQIPLNGGMQTFTDAVALTQMLAGSPDVQACFARQWTRYALNRWDTSADLASVEGASSAFQASGNMRDLIAAVATSRTFRYRTPAPGEVLP